MTTLVNIRCPALSLTISRSACGAQVTRPYAPAACRGCELGAAHARGEAPTTWADGSAVEEVAHEVEGVPVGGGWKPPATPRFAPQKHKPRRTLRLHRYRGQLLTATQIARLPEARVSAATIAVRIVSHGWDPERAATTPKGRSA